MPLLLVGVTPAALKICAIMCCAATSIVLNQWRDYDGRENSSEQQEHLVDEDYCRQGLHHFTAYHPGQSGQFGFVLYPDEVRFGANIGESDLDSQDPRPAQSKETTGEFNHLPAEIKNFISDFLPKEDFVRFASASRWYFDYHQIDIKYIANLASQFRMDSRNRLIFKQRSATYIPFCSVNAFKEIEIRLRQTKEGSTPFWNLCRVGPEEEKWVRRLLAAGNLSIKEISLNKGAATRIFLKNIGEKALIGLWGESAISQVFLMSAVPLTSLIFPGSEPVLVQILLGNTAVFAFSNFALTVLFAMSDSLPQQVTYNPTLGKSPEIDAQVIELFQGPRNDGGSIPCIVIHLEDHQ